MKDQYFGDFGDYQKISLLRHLTEGGFKVLVHWMKTLDDTSTDGKHITYLEKPEQWRLFQADIFDYLRTKVASGRRTLSHIEESSFVTGIKFINDCIEDDQDRAMALKKVIESNADIVLFDPDNGIEVPSITRKTMHKYVTWKEIGTAFASGKSVIVYQHFSRTNRTEFIQNKLLDIQEKIQCSVEAVQVKHSVYFFLIQPHHGKSLGEVMHSFTDTWQHLAVQYST